MSKEHTTAELYGNRFVVQLYENLISLFAQFYGLATLAREKKENNLLFSFGPNGNWTSKCYYAEHFSSCSRQEYPVNTLQNHFMSQITSRPVVSTTFYNNDLQSVKQKMQYQATNSLAPKFGNQRAYLHALRGQDRREQPLAIGRITPINSLLHFHWSSDLKQQNKVFGRF